MRFPIYFMKNFIFFKKINRLVFARAAIHNI